MVTRSALPQNWTTKPSDTVIEAFAGDISGWTQSGTGNISMSTEIFHGGTQSLKMEATVAGTYVQATNDVHVPLVPGNYEIWFYVDDPTKYISISIFLMDGLYTSSFNATLSSLFWLPGWNRCIISPGDWSKSGSFTWRSEMRHMRIRVTPKATEVGSVYFGSFTAGREGIGSCIFVFDDNHPTQYTVMYPLFQEFGLVANCAINSNTVGRYGKSTWAQLQEMYAAGFGISNHAADHLDLNDLTDAEIQSEVIDCANALIAHNMPRDAWHLVYPGGQYDLEVITSCIAAGALTARTTAPGFAFPGTTNYMALPIAANLNNVNIVTLARRQLSYARNFGATIIFMGHEILDSGGDYPITEANLRLVLQEVVASHVPCLTMDQWYNGLTNPRYRSLPVGRA